MRTKWLGASLLLVSAGALATLEDAQNAFKKGDYQGAVKEYRTLAEAGNVNAQIILGALYSKGGVVKRDDKTAISWLEKAAIQGNVYSNYLLGKIYEGSELPNMQQAVSWYTKAAQKGLADAQVQLGHIYSEGHGVPKNVNEAILWFGKAALQNNLDAQRTLGVMYMLGKGLPANPQIAAGWLSKAAAQGDKDSLLFLGNIYQNGKETGKKPVLAYAFYELAIKQSGQDTAFKKSAVKNRDDLSEALSPQQLEDAKKLTTDLDKPNDFSKTLSIYLKKSDQPFRFFPEK